MTKLTKAQEKRLHEVIGYSSLMPVVRLKKYIAQELARQAEEIAHKTEDGWCCACEVDMIEIENKIDEAVKRRVAKQIRRYDTKKKNT